MKSLWTALLVQAVKALASAVVWEAALQAVADLAATELSGEEKRRLALANLRRAFAAVPTRLLNLAIEIAVAKVTARP